jgi:DNA ligase-1
MISQLINRQELLINEGSTAVLFSDVAHYFSQIELTSSRLEMTELLAQLLKKATPHEANIICNLALGQLHPPYIETRLQIASKTIIKVLAQLLNQDEKEIAHQAKEKGDLGLVVGSVCNATECPLTLLQVYQALQDIEQLSGTGSQEEKQQKLLLLLRVMDCVSAKFVVRIVLGTLRLGFSDMTLVDALSWMQAGDKSLRATIEHAYNVCADLGLIAQTLKNEGIEAIKKMAVHVGIPIRPAAAERLPTAQAIVEKLGPCIAQPKLDGFRLQIHLDKNGPEPIVKFFSRHLTDMSASFPDLAQAVKQLNVQTLIAEGEAIVYDPHTGVFLPFQETVKRKRKHDIEEIMQELPLQVSLFDILYLDGKSLLGFTHEHRRKKLEELFANMNNPALRIIEEKKIETGKQLEEYFNENISAGLEGLVVKRPDSVYQPGKRNFNWIKLKRQEEGHLEDTIDAVILGYYAGSGKRTAFGVGAFLVGIYNKEQDHFETIAKIGTGLKDDDWRELKKKCDAIIVPEKPKNVVCAPELYPHVWVNPEIVCIVRADEITISPLHTAGKTATHLGYALRFPRFMGYSTQKGPYEATTVDEIKHLYKDQFIRRR